MPTQSDIARQRRRLTDYRALLAHYLDQRAKLGTAYEPPNVAGGIQEARAEIRRIKSILRRRGVVVEDLLEDSDPAEASDPIEDLPEDTGPPTAVDPIEELPGDTTLARLARRPVALAIVAAALLVLAGAVALFGLGGLNIITGNGNITNTGSGSITINQGDPPEVRRQKLERARQLLVEDILNNLQSLDARLRVANTALLPIDDPLAVPRQTVAPLGGTPAANFQQRATTDQATTIRSNWANLPIRVVVDPPLVQVLIESGVEPSGVRAFYTQMSQAQDAGDGLLTTLDSAARNSPDQRSRDYWAQRIAVDHDILRNRSRAVYAVGLQVLPQLGASPALVASGLGQLAEFAPHPPLSEPEIDQLRTTIDAEANALDQRRLALLAAGEEMRDQEVATYTALNAQLVIADSDSADVVGVKASKLRRLGRFQEALAGFERYERLMADDQTTPQYVRTARSLTQQNELNLRGGVYIFALKPEGAAAQAGIQVGDVVVTYDGSTVALPDDLKTATELTPAGKSVVVEWLRLDAGGHWSMQHGTVPAGPLGAGLMAI